LDTDWVEGGRGPLLNNEEIDAIVERLKEEGSGRVYSRSDFEQILLEAVREKIVKAGGDLDDAKTSCSKSTLDTYIGLFKSKLNSCFWKDPNKP